jgi:hypothetical protein
MSAGFGGSPNGLTAGGLRLYTVGCSFIKFASTQPWRFSRCRWFPWRLLCPSRPRKSEKFGRIAQTMRFIGETTASAIFQLMPKAIRDSNM